jgi:uncharacterized protein GlcG (DUF336 family)
LITLALAARMTAAAIEQAAEVGALVSAAVVDAGGHLVHFQRMDGAEIAGPTLAVDKLRHPAANVAKVAAAHEGPEQRLLLAASSAVVAVLNWCPTLHCPEAAARGTA